MDDIYQEFWEAYLEAAGLPETTYCGRCTYFGGSEEESVAQAEALLRGEKTAVSHCIPYYLVTRTALPKIGDYCVITDFYGNPCCILRTEDVTLTPMPEVPEALIRGETGQSREDWLADRHTEYQALAKRFGFHYHEEIPVLMETVSVVFPMK